MVNLIELGFTVTEDTREPVFSPHPNTYYRTINSEQRYNLKAFGKPTPCTSAIGNLTK